MAADGVRITGLRETIRDLEKFGVSTDDLKDAFTKISGQVAQAAQGLVPTSTGRLQGSIRPARTKNKAVVRAGNTGRIQYAAPINYGWPAHNIEPTEFLTRPANTDLDAKAAAIEAELTALIRKYDLD